MTRKELSQVYYLDKLIEHEISAIRQMKDSLLRVTPVLSDMPKSPNVSNPIENLVPQLIDKENALNERICEYTNTKRRIMVWIDEIDDLHIRMVFLLRFVDLLPWNEVAEALGGGNTESSVKKMCYRYLKKAG